MSNLGTVVKGIKAPIIRQGDDLVEVVCQSLGQCIKDGDVVLRSKDVLCVTEAVLAKSQGNYASMAQLSQDVRNKFSSKTVGIVFPIFSRNRFAFILKGLAQGLQEAIVQLPFPFDEVGNPLLDINTFEEKEIDPNRTFTAQEFYEIFPKIGHPFTGVDYIDLYLKQNPNIKVILSNKAEAILEYTDSVIVADIHKRAKTKKRLLNAGASKVLCLDELMNAPIEGSGYNPDYGVLGSNISTDSSIKLFPRDSKQFAVRLQARVKQLFGADIECMVYGDGAFKDSRHSIWELADPVISPGFTDGLLGTPNELKIKYISENALATLSKDEALKEMKRLVQEKHKNTNEFNTQGTTPRMLTDLLGSLADLTSGSGDKGTPFVLIQNYFGNIATEY